jgi:hypothetical protein
MRCLVGAFQHSHIFFENKLVLFFGSFFKHGPWKLETAGSSRVGKEGESARGEAASAAPAHNPNYERMN